MPQDRYYINAPLKEGNTYSLTDGEWHHLAHVAKARVNKRIELVNGRGQLAQARVAALGKRSAEIGVDQVWTDERKKPDVILALAMPKKNHLDWVIEKGTELNATQFWIFPGMHSEITELSAALEMRLVNLTIAAMKQSGRLDLPEIHRKPPLLEWAPFQGTALFGDLSPEAPYLWTLGSIETLPLVLFIGPESGFDPQEERFLTHSLKAKGVRLHSNILRAETAPLVGLSLIQIIVNNK